MHNPIRQRGVTMIENMVALLLLSFALLGLAGLLSRTLNREGESSFQTLASIQAQDVAERMRVNIEAYDAGDYAKFLGPSGNPTAQACNSPTSNCAPGKLAEDDAAAWALWLADALPNGEGVVCQDATPDDGTGRASAACSGTGPTVIKIFWSVRDLRASASNAAAGADVQRFTMVFQP